MREYEKEKCGRQLEKYKEEKERLARVKREMEDCHQAVKTIYDSLLETWETDVMMYHNLLDDFSHFLQGAEEDINAIEEEEIRSFYDSLLQRRKGTHMQPQFWKPRLFQPLPIPYL